MKTTFRICTNQYQAGLPPVALQILRKMVSSFTNEVIISLKTEDILILIKISILIMKHLILRRAASQENQTDPAAS